MIQGFADPATEDLYNGKKTARARRFPADIKPVAVRKLDMLDHAQSLKDLRVPPANRLERLKGNLAGLCSIRINDQWRVVFRWTGAGPDDVRIVDYHE